MSQPNDLSRCLATLEQGHTIIAVIEMSQSSWLVAGIVPGVERHPLKKLEPDEEALLRLLQRWRDEAAKDLAARRPCRLNTAMTMGVRGADQPGVSISRHGWGGAQDSFPVILLH